MKAEVYEFGSKFGVSVDGKPIEIGTFFDSEGTEIDGGPILYADKIEADSLAKEINDTSS